jgi:hypothetical protein
MRRRVIGLLTALVAGALAACGDESDAARPPPDVVIDERAGTFDGVGLGDRPAEIRRALGRGTDRRMISRLPRRLSVTELGLPWTLDPVPGVSRKKVLTMRRDGVSMLVAPRTGAYAVFVWRPRARTSRGVAVGDDLDAARERYEDLRCDVRNRNSEYGSYPFCEGRVGDTYVWFGQDPIRSISLASTPLG